MEKSQPKLKLKLCLAWLSLATLLKYILYKKYYYKVKNKSKIQRGLLYLKRKKKIGLKTLMYLKEEEKLKQ